MLNDALPEKWFSALSEAFPKIIEPDSQKLLVGNYSQAIAELSQGEVFLGLSQDVFAKGKGAYSDPRPDPNDPSKPEANIWLDPPTAKTPRMAKWGRPTHPTGPRPDTADTASAGPRAPFHRANHPPLAAGLQPSSHEPLPGRARVPSQCRHKSLLPPLYGLDRAREERAQRRGIQTGPVLGNDATDDIYDLKLKSVPGCLAPGGYNLREPVRGVKCEEVLFEAWSKCDNKGRGGTITAGCLSYGIHARY
ncbi:hypothetical protein MMC10_005248 [Thelotrema lepadinum]|nr:hypothetical protein [Thelotrema lepadinum]